MEDLKKIEMEELEMVVVDAGVDTDIGTRGVCCGAAYMPIRIWP